MSKETEKIEALEAENTQLNASIEKKDETIAEQTKVIKELQSELKTLAGKKTTKDVIHEHKGVKYLSTIPKFKFEGKEYNHEDLDKETIAKLVDARFGGFQAIEEKKGK